MDVILTQRVPGVGVKGDRRRVPDGYARNFLIPKMLAVPVGSSAGAALQRSIERGHALVEANQSHQAELAKKLEGSSFRVAAKASPTGSLFGRINAKQIIETLRQDGFDVSNADIKPQSPIDSLGKHTVDVSFGHGLKAGITLEVVNANSKT